MVTHSSPPTPPKPSRNPTSAPTPSSTCSRSPQSTTSAGRFREWSWITRGQAWIRFGRSMPRPDSLEAAPNIVGFVKVRLQQAVTRVLRRHRVPRLSSVIMSQRCLERPRPIPSKERCRLPRTVPCLRCLMQPCASHL